MQQLEAEGASHPTFVLIFSSLISIL
jgi:hypothetical protein